MRGARRKLTVGMLLMVSVFALAWFFLAPAKLGGKTTYVVTHGVSMEPRFHTGDLAILRTAPKYGVGDVVAYRSATLHTVVMHRIVGDDNGVFTFKGDNNGWADPDHPTASAVLGKLSARVPHGGRYLAALDSTAGRAVAGGVIALLLLGGATRARRRRALRTSGGAGRHRAARQPTPNLASTSVTPAKSHVARGQLALASLVLLVLAGGELWLLKMPDTAVSSRTAVVSQTGTFGYSASVPPSVVYPDGTVNSGDPIFTQIAHQLDFSFDYQAGAPLSGTVSLAAALVGPGGWSAPLGEGGSTPIRDGRGHATVSVDLDRAASILREFAAATAVKSVSTSLVITPAVAATGSVGGQPVSGTFAGKLTLSAGANQLAVVTVPGSGSASAASDPLVVSSPIDVAMPAYVASTLHVQRWRIGVKAARIALGGAVALVAGWLVVVLVGGRRATRDEDDVVAILRRYGERIVDAEAIPLDGPVVELSSLAALHSIAERYDRVILHTARGERHVYVVRDELSWYRYEIRPPRGQHAAPRKGRQESALAGGLGAVISLTTPQAPYAPGRFAA